ncbi:MAG: NADH-quinone oxidoreductase subunit M [bacterium]
MLTIIVFLPLLGTILISLFVPRRFGGAVRWGTLAVAVLNFVLALYLLREFSVETSGFQIVEKHQWLPDWGVTYTLGVDGLSLMLILLSNLLSALAVMSSFAAIRVREKEYYFFLSLLQTGILGTFAALDLFLFYIFWETMLIPLYFLIGIWGGEKRIYATFKFLLYTLTGSLLMLVGILVIYFQMRAVIPGSDTEAFNYMNIVAQIRSGALVLKPELQFWLFLAFFFAFAIKVPLFPLHTWLPDAHTEAPTAGSVILAGVLLKTGVYGIFRFCFMLFPATALELRGLVGWIAVVAILYGAFTAMAQKDMKRLVAYSSVSHMGFVMLGLFSLNLIALKGSMLQMLNHGISTGALFLLVGMIYERRHTRLMSEMGGLAQQLPVYAVFFMIILLSSIGLPGLNGFVGEFMILLGAFRAKPAWAVVGALGVVFGAVYLLMLYQRVFFGPLDKPANKELKDLGWREVAVLMPLVILAVWIGLYPKPFLKYFDAPSQAVVEIVAAPQTYEFPTGVAASPAASTPHEVVVEAHH